MLSPGNAELLSRALSHDAPPVIDPLSEDRRWLEHTALQLLDEHQALGRRPLATHHALRKSMLEALVLRLSDAPTLREHPMVHAGADSLYGRFRDAVELHYRKLRQADEYARLLGCSVRTLNRATSSTVGRGVRQIIDNRRLVEAQRLLHQAKWDPQVVARHLGFANVSNFNRSFQTQTGLSPTTFTTEHDPRSGTFKEA